MICAASLRMCDITATDVRITAPGSKLPGVAKLDQTSTKLVLASKFGELERTFWTISLTSEKVGSEDSLETRYVSLELLEPLFWSTL